MADSDAIDLSIPKPVTLAGFGASDRTVTGTLANVADTVVVDIGGASMATVDVSGTATSGTFTISRTSFGGIVILSSVFASNKQRLLDVPIGLFQLPDTFVMPVLGLQTLTLTADASFVGNLTVTVRLTSNSRFVGINNEVAVTNAPAFTGIYVTVVAAAADTQLLARDTTRRGFSVFNDSAAILYLGLSSTTVSTTAYTVQVPPNGYYECPTLMDYAGVVRGIWSSATGNARITYWQR